MNSVFLILIVSFNNHFVNLGPLEFADQASCIKASISMVDKVSKKGGMTEFVSCQPKHQ